jgi:hypothetical protein
LSSSGSTELADPIRALEVGEAKDVEELGAAGWTYMDTGDPGRERMRFLG